MPTRYCKNNDNRSTKIIVQTNILNAVAKNKKENNILANYCKSLDRRLAASCKEMEKENFKCKLTLKNLDTEFENNMRVDNTQNGYFNLMRQKKFNKNNYFLPCLLKSLNDQEKMLSRSIGDMIQYQLGDKTYPEKSK